MRRHRLYKLSFENESKLEGIWNIRMSSGRLILVGISLLIVLFVVVGAIIMLTPLRTMLPGYMTKSERINTIETVMRLDSLKAEHDKRQAYIDNIFIAFDTERNTHDSIELKSSELSLPLDSLLPVSPIESEFIREMEEKEKYNISILAPLAAEGMIFMPVCDGFVIENETKDAFATNIIVPLGTGINAISDGIIIDNYRNPTSKSYTLIIQHNKGFLSKYSMIGQPLVEKGDKVTAGQRITLPNTNSSHITLEMWHNGSPLKPYNYIKQQDFNKTPIIDEEIGRGR